MLSVLAVVAGLLNSISADDFIASQPQAHVVRNPAGWVTVVSHLETESYGETPELAARAFFAAHGSSFGLSKDDALLLANTPKTGEFATVVFRREVNGLAVIDGQVMAMVTPDGRVHSASSTGPLPPVRSIFALTQAEAQRAATARLDGDVIAASAGWVIWPDELRPTYLMSIVAQTPYRSHRFTVDAVTGHIGIAPSVLQTLNKAKVYKVSPSKPFYPAAPCTTTTDAAGNIKYNLCAQAEEVTLLGLAAGSKTLTGSATKGDGRTTVYNCAGKTTYTTTACKQTMLADTNGDFTASSLTDYGTNKSDTESEVMAYYHVDRHSRFMDSLDPSFSGLPLIPGFTNGYGPGVLFPTSPGPLDNAFYDPTNKIMVFGQGSTVDFAYDAEVVYHEMTHATCDAIGNASSVVGALSPIAAPNGLFDDPLAINEGNADTFAVMEPGVWDPYLGEFDARDEINLIIQKIPVGPLGYVRNMAPTVMKTCQGNGTAGNPGRDGEAHDDGEVWGNFTYETFVGLRGVANSATQPGGSAAAAPMMRALEALIALPLDQQGYTQYANLFSSQVKAMHGTDAGNYVECVKTRHDLAGCDGQFVTVYSGEGPANDMYVKNAWKAFYYSPSDVYQNKTPPNFEGIPAGLQWKITVPAGATALEVKICDLQGAGKVFLQKGGPVTLKVTGAGMTADWTYPITASQSGNFGACSGLLGGAGNILTLTLTPTGCTGCNTGGVLTGDKLAPGDWYILATNTGTSQSFAQVNFKLTGGTIPTRPVSTPVTCTLGGPITGTGGGPGTGGGTTATGGGTAATGGGTAATGGGTAATGGGTAATGGGTAATGGGTAATGGGTAATGGGAGATGGGSGHSDAGIDAGVTGADAGTDTTKVNNKGCGCSSEGGMLSLLGLLGYAARRRRQEKH